MKGKNILFSVCILALLMCVSVVSAATFTVSPATITFTPSDNSNDITITNTNTSNPLSVSLSLPTVNGVTFQATGDVSDINTSVITITPTSAIDYSNIEFLESLSGNLIITNPATSETSTIQVVVENDRFCEFANPGDLDIEIDDIKNLGVGEDDKWYPLSQIEVTVIVENKGNEDISDVTLEWGLYSEDDNKWVIELVDEDSFDINEDDEETVTFTIDLSDDLDVDLDELTDGSYTLYARATGEMDTDDKNDTCISSSESTDIIIEKDYVVLDNMKIVGTPSCGATIQVTADVSNIGEDDQSDVYVVISNTDFKINEKVAIGDIDAFDDKQLTFEFTLPSGIKEKTYYLYLSVYDDSDDVYENSDDDKANFEIPVIVSGNCVNAPEAVVYASLESGGKAGESLVIKATVTNTGSSSGTFTISAADYSTWAELVSVEPSSVTLNAKESKDVTITLNVDSEASANQSFNILLKSATGSSLSQPIAVTIENGFSFSGLFGGNAYIWGIALLNIILVVMIIVIAVRVARR